MRIGMRAEHAGDHELCAGKLLAQHAHERDRAAFAHVHRRLVEERQAGVVDGFCQPWRHLGRIPARRGLFQFQRHLCAVGWVAQQGLFQQFATGLAVGGWRQTQRQLHRGLRTQHVAGRRQRRHAIHTGDRQRRAPGAVQHQLGEVVVHRHQALDHRELVKDGGIQRRRSGLGLRQPFGWHLHMQPVQQDAAAGFVLDPRQQLAQQAEAGRHYAGGIARMHAFLQHLHAQVAAGQPAQRGGAPQLLIVAAARIQAHHQRWLADACGQMVDVGRQVVAAGFLAGLDQHHAARMRQALGAQRQYRRQQTEDRVTIVGATAPVQLVVAQHRLPWAEVRIPAGHFRLLVQVAVQQHGVVARFGTGCRNLDEDQRRAAFEAHHLDLHALDGLRARPGFHQGDRLLHVAVRDPIGVEHRRFIGDANVIDQLRDDLAVPGVADELVDLGAVHGDSECMT